MKLIAQALRPTRRARESLPKPSRENVASTPCAMLSSIYGACNSQCLAGRSCLSRAEQSFKNRFLTKRVGPLLQSITESCRRVYGWDMLGNLPEELWAEDLSRFEDLVSTISISGCLKWGKVVRKDLGKAVVKKVLSGGRLAHIMLTLMSTPIHSWLCAWYPIE